MTLIDRIKNHQVITILISVGAVVGFLVTILPYITGVPDLPTLVKSFSTTEVNKDEGDRNEGVENKAERPSARAPDKMIKTAPIAAPKIKQNTDPVIKSDKIKPTVVSDGISQKPVDQNLVRNKKQKEIPKIRFSADFTYPCSGSIDQFAGVSLNHVHVMPTTSSPSQPAVEGGANVNINKSIFRDNKNWYEIIYVTNGQKITGWLPTNYVIPSTDCQNN